MEMKENPQQMLNHVSLQKVREKSNFIRGFFSHYKTLVHLYLVPGSGFRRQKDPDLKTLLFLSDLIMVRGEQA